MRLLPHTLLWRTFLLVAVLMLLSVLAWFAIFRATEQEPHAQQMARLIASVVNVTRSAILNAAPENRHALLLDLSDREGIHVYPVESNEAISELEDNPMLQSVADQLRNELGPMTRLTLERNGEQAVFVSFGIDEGEAGEYWLALPRSRIERLLHRQWISWGLAALLLSLGGAYLLMFSVTRPLRALSRATREIGQGRQPAPIKEEGPGEIIAVAHAFNQMSADLARLDSDRALILAGISHDLRTPLARLRIGIELMRPDDTDQATRNGMIADVEEIDRTIGQFLDFARESGGEALQETDLNNLLAELVAHYARRNVAIKNELNKAVEPGAPSSRPLPLMRRARPQAMRRAIANLIDNALRHAGPNDLELALHEEKGNILIELRDRGPGIPAQDVERLKLPFTRLESARSNVSGAGLGLAIVARIVRGHGGMLQLLPRENGGLIARIVLPRHQPN